MFFLLSIISYSRFDKALLRYNIGEVINSFGGQNGVGVANNWFGILGAYIADFSINSTIGVFAIIFPVIIGIWAYSLFRKVDFRFLMHISNFLLLMGILLSALFGVLRQEITPLFDMYELSGFVGEYLGKALDILLGGLGSVILLGTSIVAVLIIFFDVKVEKPLIFIRDWFIEITNSLSEKISESAEKKKEQREAKKQESENILEENTKTESLKTTKTEKKDPIEDELVEVDEHGEEIEEKKDTTIRIVKKDEDFKKKKHTEKSETEETTEKEEEQEEKPKPKDDVVAATDREEEAKLPEPWEEKIQYKNIPLDLLDDVPEDQDGTVAEEELTRNAELLKDKLALFDIEIKDISVTPGPVVTLYEIVPAPGVKISKIVGLENDIALALAARGIRIIAPIPGKSAIGVEIPNATPSMVVARQVFGDLRKGKSKNKLPLALGKTISGDVCITDLAKMPHMLIAGSTGSGKSVGINTMICSLLYAKHPSEIKFAIIDPKKIELSFYNKLRHHYLAVCPDLDEDIITVPTNAVLLLKSVEMEMEQRYDKLAKAGVRHLEDYNIKVADPMRKPNDTDTMKHHPLPYIVVIIDELADLMITAGKEVEEPIARLAQLARAVGIHLIVATQRPSVNVITGTIKANFSARVGYQVASKIDSRTILDMNGAERLLGRGDMLFLPGGVPKPQRVQNAFISTEEVERITDYIDKQDGYSKPYYLPSLYDQKGKAGGGMLEDMDELFEDAARVIVRHQQGSVSLLQRRLKLGYSRAARIVDQLEDAGIVGPNDGSKARSVLVEDEEQLETILRSL